MASANNDAFNHCQRNSQLLLGSLLYLLTLLLIFLLDPAVRRRAISKKNSYAVVLHTQGSIPHTEYKVSRLSQNSGTSGTGPERGVCTQPICERQPGVLDIPQKKTQIQSVAPCSYRASCLHLNRLGVSTFGCVSSSSSEIWIIFCGRHFCERDINGEGRLPASQHPSNIDTLVGMAQCTAA